MASSPWPACGGYASTASTKAPSAACSEGLVWNCTLRIRLVSVAVGTEFAVREAASGTLEAVDFTLALGGGTALYLLCTVVVGLAVRSGATGPQWLWLGAAAVALAVGLLWPLGLPVELLVALDLGAGDAGRGRRRGAAAVADARFARCSTWNMARRDRAGQFVGA